MTREELQKYDQQCYNGVLDIDNEKFGAAEYRYFDRCRRVYELWRKQRITTEQARRLKGEAYNDYLGDIKLHDMWFEGVKRYQQMVKDTEGMLNAYSVTHNTDYLRECAKAFGLFPEQIRELMK